MSDTDGERIVMVASRLLSGLELDAAERNFAAKMLLELLRVRAQPLPHRQADPLRGQLIAMEYELRNDGRHKSAAVALEVAQAWGLKDGKSVLRHVREWKGRFKIEGDPAAFLEWIERNRS